MRPYRHDRDLRVALSLIAVNWFVANKDLVSLIIATIAVGLSFMTVMAQRHQQRHEAYRHLHEQLIEPQVRVGRARAYAAAASGVVPPTNTEEWNEINRAITLFDTMAIYYRKNLIPRRLALDTWHHGLRDIRAGAKLVAQQRNEEHHTWTAWPNLWPLIERAVNYRTKLLVLPARRARSGDATTPDAVQQESTATTPPKPAEAERPHPA